MERCIQLLTFEAIQFLDLPKANKKMTKRWKQAPLSVHGETLLSFEK
jgi:hypothetical protein